MNKWIKVINSIREEEYKYSYKAILKLNVGIEILTKYLLSMLKIKLI